MLLYTLATGEGLVGAGRERFVIDAVKEAFTLSWEEIEAQVEDKGGGEVWGTPAATMAYGMWLAWINRADDRHQEQAMMWVQEALANRPWEWA
jgi:hypothetical protein